MMDDTTGAGGSGAPEGVAERVAFCQQCGQELTAVTVRRVGSAVYCEPCLVARLEGVGSTAGGSAAGPGPWRPVSSAGSPGGAGPTGGAPSSGAGGSYATGPVSGEPNPWLAALLGLIPGVGAMYNGQYAKGLAHLVIFAVLDALSHDMNQVFGIFVVGWVFYQAFDAYHTAKARRDGTPLPNPFGLNDIGDRMGFGKTWPGSAARPVTTAPPGGWAASATTSGTAKGPSWTAYAPSTNYGVTGAPATGAAASGPAPGGVGAPPTTSWNAPYGQSYAGETWQTPVTSVAPGPGIPMGAPIVPTRRFPVGAAWLIGLGLLFLLTNLDPAWRVSGRWSVPILLAALGTWLLYRRAESVRSAARLAGEGDGFTEECGRRLVCQIRLPVMLLVAAVLFALQAAGVMTFGQTWPVLFIAFGALLLLERTVGRSGWPPVSGAAPAGYAGTTSTWTTGQGETRKDGR
jgi:hypothetical protein